jgi:hypothetical protein
MTTHEGHAARPSLGVPETNRMALGLYVTPEDACRVWTADPERVHILPGGLPRMGTSAGRTRGCHGTTTSTRT